MVTARPSGRLAFGRLASAAACALSGVAFAEVSPPNQLVSAAGRDAGSMFATPFIQAGYSVFGSSATPSSAAPQPFDFDALGVTSLPQASEALRLAPGPADAAPVKITFRGPATSRVTFTSTALPGPPAHAAAVAPFRADDAIPLLQASDFGATRDPAGLHVVTGLRAPTYRPEPPKVDPVLVFGAVVGLAAAGGMIGLAIVKLPR